MGQLTETGVNSTEQLMKSFEHIEKSGDYYDTVVDDVTLGQVVTRAILTIEHILSIPVLREGEKKMWLLVRSAERSSSANCYCQLLLC